MSVMDQDSGTEPKEETKGPKADPRFMPSMRSRYQRSVDRERTNRERAREDLNFKVGNQWPTNIIQDREINNRPVLTFNRMLSVVRQVTGDVRQNKPAINVRPVGEGGDKRTAEVFAGLIRNIEQQSFAQYVYSLGADNATSCGQGAWRIITEYTDDDSFLQDIRIKPIANALSVVWDPDSVELDKSDARFCFVYSTMPKEEFKASYPEASEQPFDKADQVRDAYGDWFTEDEVRVAEYWCKVPVTKTIAQLSDGRVICLDDIKPDELEAKMAGATIAQKRKVKSHKVMCHIVSGAEELEEPAEWAGKYIPIVHVMGEETWVDEKRVTYGLIRYAKDAQRAYNYARSTSIEVTGLQPKAQWLLSTAMIEGYGTYWQNAGNTNYPYLPYNADPNLPNQTPRREHPPQPAAGLIAEAQLAADDIKSTTGIYDASLGAKSNETSGIAIAQRKQEGDVSTFVYIDNLNLAIASTGRQLIDLIPKIYDTRRVMRVLYEDGEDDQVTLNHSQIGQDGQQRTLHMPDAQFYDLTTGKYDVVVSSGPSFSSRREEAATGMLELMRAYPPSAVVIGPRLAKTQDWPQAEEIADDMKKLLPPQLQEGAPQGPPPPPPPNQKDLTQAEKNLADAEYKKEQTRGLQLTNATTELQLAQMIGGVQNELSQMRALLAGGMGQQQPQQPQQPIQGPPPEAQPSQPPVMQPIVIHMPTSGAKSLSISRTPDGKMAGAMIQDVPDAAHGGEEGAGIP